MLHFVVCDYSPAFYSIVNEKGYELAGKSDLKFMEKAIKMFVSGLKVERDVWVPDGAECGAILKSRKVCGTEVDHNE